MFSCHKKIFQGKEPLNIVKINFGIIVGLIISRKLKKVRKALVLDNYIYEWFVNFYVQQMFKIITDFLLPLIVYMLIQPLHYTLNIIFFAWIIFYCQQIKVLMNTCGLRLLLDNYWWSRIKDHRIVSTMHIIYYNSIVVEDV